MNGGNRKHSMAELIEAMYPLHRSMTGQGVRQTFDLLSRWLPLDVYEVPSGKSVFDWNVPQEWSVRDAFIETESGERLVNYADSNLHILNGSSSIDATLQWTELAPHVHSLKDRPSSIPYRTAFLRNEWGFCVTDDVRRNLAAINESLRVRIDSSYFDGSLSYAEWTLDGESEDSVLIYCHTCHPSLANDNLSGIAVAAQLAQQLLTKQRRLTYRFVFAPATIGAVVWLAENQNHVVPTIRHGLVLSLLGSNAPFTYKRSRQEDCLTDQIVSQHVTARGGEVRRFCPFGYDERQFCSPGFDLPVGCLTRTPHAEFPEYHTSDDNLDFIQEERLFESVLLLEQIMDSFEAHIPPNWVSTSKRARSVQSPSVEKPLRCQSHCEPFLGKYDLYTAFGQKPQTPREQESLMWVLNLSDGHHSPKDMAQRSHLDEVEIHCAIEKLRALELIEIPSGVIEK
ncbi:MAG: DUF4910 domain-containing protein [Aureliella sp.]